MQVKEAYIAYRTTKRTVPNVTVTTPAAVESLMRTTIEARPDQEQLWVLLFDAHLRLLGRHCCFVGTLDGVLICPREILRLALLASAHSFIVVHNHPSGNPQPSDQDIEATRLLGEASRAVGVQMLDHVIIGSASDDPRGVGFWSFTNDK